MSRHSFSRNNPHCTKSPRKQRNKIVNAPSHIRRRMMAAPLSAELRKKYNVRSMPVRVGDEVMVMKGTHHDREGRVTKVRRNKFAIYVERVTRERSDGRIIDVPLKACNCLITKLRLDKSREAILTRKCTGRNHRFEQMGRETVTPSL